MTEKHGALVPELRALDPVPSGERHGTTASVAWVWFAANMSLPPWYLGVLALILGLSVSQSIVSIVVANVIGCAMMAVVAMLAPETGLPSIPLTRRIFGTAGNALASALNAVSCLGWYTVNAVVGAFALTSLIGTSYGLSLAIVALLLIVVAWYGHDLVHVVERYASYVLLVLYVIMAIRMFALPQTAAGAKAAGQVGTLGDVLLVVAIIASYVFSWAPYAGDYARYLPQGTSRGKVFWATFIGSFVSCAFVEILGVLAAQAVGVAGSPTDVLTRAMGALAAPALIAVVVGTVTANTLNVYTGAISSLSLGFPIKRTWMAVIFGIVGGVLAWLGAGKFSGNYENFLLVISYWVSPWIGLVLAWVLARATGVAVEAQKQLGLLVVFVIGILSTIPFMDQTLYEGPVAKALGGGDIGYWVGFVVAFVLGWVVLRGSRAQVGAAQTGD